MVELSVDHFFEPRGGDPRFIKDFVSANPGPYPVYSASVVRPFGEVNTFDYEGSFLTWVMNGYGGRMQEIHGKFSLNRDRGVLLPKKGIEIPDLTYLQHVIEPRLMERAVGRRVDGAKNEYTKIYPEEAAATVFELPVTASGELDLPRMAAFGEKLRRIRTAKAKVLAAREPLSRATCPVPEIASGKTISLGEESYFTLSIGKRVLRNDHVDVGVPVYSANVRTPFGSIGASNLESFDKPSLIWGIDGIFDWNYIDAGSVFATTDHCGRLQTTSPEVDLEYVYQYLRLTRDRFGFDRVYRASLTNVRRDVSVLFPINSSGGLCLDSQRSMARVMKLRERARTAAISSLDEVLGSSLSISD